MSEVTIQFPIDELAERFREIVKEEFAAMANEVPKPYYNDSLIDTQQLCSFLDITEPTAIKWRQKGKIPYYQIGSAIRYDKNEVMKALKK